MVLSCYGCPKLVLVVQIEVLWSACGVEVEEDGVCWLDGESKMKVRRR